MSELHGHIDRDAGVALPPEVQAALASESPAERAALEATWAAAGRYVEGEPDEAVFRQMGAEIWSVLEPALFEEESRLPLGVRAALADEPREERAALEATWDAAGRYVEGEPDEEVFRQMGAEMWPALEAAINQDQPARRERSPLRLVKVPLRLVQTKTFYRVAVAACLALVIAVGVLLMQRPITVSAPFGEIVHAELPDGSDVVLNSGATIRYSRHYGEEARRVELDGEAYFSVEHGEVPFTVETFNGATTVLGTQFNVRAWPDDLTPVTRVDLLTGRVRFIARSTGASVTLEPGQSAVLTADGSVPILVDEAEVEHAVSWRDGAFKFSNVPLATVADEMERRYDLHIEIRSEHLRRTPVTLLYDQPPGVEEILRDIAEYNACEFRAIPGGYEIYQPDAE